MSGITGVSVIVCCFNSRTRLYPTLKAISEQEFGHPLNWEIILVDNASTDSTAVLAAEIWDSIANRPNIDFRIIHESKPGQNYARKTGMSHARFRFVLFCDDDNWLSKNYIQGIFDILSADSTIGACGGLGIPVFETSKPFWFDTYAEAFAVGDQMITSYQGKILNLYGAGLAVNADAYRQLEKVCFEPIMTGRIGNALSSSDDTELTYALVLMDFKLHFAPGLTFYHFLPKQRLEFSYLKKLFAAFGKDGPVRNLYYAHITHRYRHRLIQFWTFHLILGVFRLVKYFFIPPKRFGRPIYADWSISYIRQLFAIRKDYRNIISRIHSIHQPELVKNKKNIAAFVVH